MSDGCSDSVSNGVEIGIVFPEFTETGAVVNGRD